MVTTTTVSRRVTDEEPSGFDPVDVRWDDDGHLVLDQDEGTISMQREHAAAVARAITDALTDEGARGS